LKQNEEGAKVSELFRKHRVGNTFLISGSVSAAIGMCH